MQPKPLFETATAKSALLGMLGTVLLAFAQTSGKIAARHYPQHAQDIADVADFINQVGLILGLGGGLGAIAGRAAASSPTYTAHWLPGKNREDFMAPSSGKDTRCGETETKT